MTTPATADLLRYANLQMAAEAFLIDETTGLLKSQVKSTLINGNKHASVFVESEAIAFDAEWTVLDQKANTATGLSGTLFKNKITGERVLSFRSTEFVDDAVRDNQADFGVRSCNATFVEMQDLTPVFLTPFLKSGDSGSVIGKLGF